MNEVNILIDGLIEAHLCKILWV